MRPRADVPDGAQGVRRGWSRYTARVAGLNDPGQDPEAYPHIHSVLARRIRGGEYPAGARLPTETELADEFGCGLDVAATRALRALQRDGLAEEGAQKRVRIVRDRTLIQASHDGLWGARSLPGL